MTSTKEEATDFDQNFEGTDTYSTNLDGIRWEEHCKDMPVLKSQKKRFTDLDGFLGKWAGERLIVVSCFRDELSREASAQLMESHELPVFHVKPTIDEQQISLDQLAQDPSLGPGIYYLPVEECLESRGLLDDYLFYNASFKRLGTYLNNNERLVIIELMPDQLGERTKTESVVPIWYLDYIDYLSYEKQQLERLKDQVNRGFWGATERESYEEINSHHNNQKLADQIDDFDKSGGMDRLRLDDLVVTAFDQLYDKGTPYRLVMFVMTWFPKVSVPDFNRVLEVLLRAFAEDDFAQLDTPLEEWIRDADEVRKNLGIGFTRSGRLKVLAFQDFKRQRQLKIYFSDHRYSFFMRCYREIRQSSILFHFGDNVMDRANQLLVETAQQDPEEFGEKWLRELVCCLARLNEGENETDHPLASILKQLKVHERRRTVVRILRSFIASGFENEIKNVLEHMIHQNAHGELFHLIRRLGMVAEFPEYHWLRQVLDRSSGKQEELIKKVKQTIFERTRSGSSFFQTLKEIEKWRPREAPPKPAPRSSWVYVDVVITMLLKTLEQFDESEVWGDSETLPWPDGHWAFATRDVNDLEPVLTFFHHPWFESRLKKAFQLQLARHAFKLPEQFQLKLKYLDDFEKQSWTFVEDCIWGKQRMLPEHSFLFSAILIWRWCAALVSYRLERSGPEADQCFQQLLTKLASLTNPTQQELYLLIWRNLEQAKRGQIERIIREVEREKKEPPMGVYQLNQYLSRHAASLRLVRETFSSILSKEEK